MARYDFWALGETSVTISGGGQLDGVTQGDGSHLIGLTITLNTTNYEQLEIRDRGDAFFDDNDGDQKLRGSQTFDGVTYSGGTVIEAEYVITMLDPNTGIEYKAVAVNVNNSTPSYATVEGLAFIDVLPPPGVALQVTDATEGPGGYGVPSLPSGDIAAPACFTPGTLIRTPDGERPVEALKAGDLVTTLDNGPQELRWAGRAEVGPFRMALSPAFRPVRIHRDAFGPGKPMREMVVSPQHRVLVEGWKAELLFGEPQVLAAAKHLIDGKSVTQAWDKTEITYLHLQFDRHEIVFSDGLPTESFNPGPAVLGSMPNEARAELEALFPDHNIAQAAPLEAVRPLITGREVRALLAA